MFTSGLTIDSANFIPKNIYAPINETAIIDPTTIIINILKEIIFNLNNNHQLYQRHYQKMYFLLYLVGLDTF